MNVGVKLLAIAAIGVSLSGCYVATVRSGYYYEPGYVESNILDEWYDYPYYVSGGVYYYYHPHTRTVVYTSPRILVRPVVRQNVHRYVAPTVHPQHFERAPVIPRPIERVERQYVPQRHIVPQHQYVPQQHVVPQQHNIPQHYNRAPVQQQAPRRYNKDWQR